MEKIAPIHTPIIPPSGAVAAGVTPNGKQLYRLVRKRSRAVPLLDENGKQLYKKNRVTGEPILPINKPEIYDEEKLFYMEADGQGNLHMVDYTPPSEEELREAERRQQVLDMQSQLAEVLVDEGFTPQELVRVLRTPPAPRGGNGAAADSGDAGESEHAPPEVVREEVNLDDYPKHVAGGMWDLSDGTRVGGSGEAALKRAQAEELEKEVRQRAAEALENAAVTPEF